MQSLYHLGDMTKEIQGDNEEDLLYSTAQKYDELLDIGYHIIVGRKGKAYHIQLRFWPDCSI